MSARFVAMMMLLLLPALTQAQPAAPCRQSGPLSEAQLTILVKNPAPRTIQLVASCGIDFEPDEGVIGRLRSAGAPETVLDAVRAATAPAERLWESIKDSRDPAAFEDYLRRYPEGQFAAPARQRYRDLKVAAVRAEMERSLAAGQWDAADGKIRDLLRVVPENDEIRGWQRQIANGRERDRLTREAAVEAELEYWRSIKDSSDPALFEAYQGRYPSGQFIEIAKTKLQALRTAKPPNSESPKGAPSPPPDLAKEAWEKVKGARDRTSLETFVRQFGSSEYAKLARVELVSMGTADFDEGLRHSQAQRWPQAIAAFTRAINKQFGPEAYVQRGLSYLYLHDFDQAATDFSRAIEIKPDSADAYLGRGVVQEHARKWPECIQDLSRAIAIIPSAVAFRGRGTCYQSSSDYVKAAEDFGKAIELMPQDADAYRDRGLFYLGTRKYAEAVQDLSKAIEYAPQDPAAYRMRATAERSIGNSAAADEDSRRFEELNRVRQMFTDASLAGPLRFFSSGKDSGPKVVREYKERFPKGQTQYVNWELRLAYASPPGKRVDFTIQEVWFRPDGSIDHKHEVKGRVEAGWLSEAISGGWGSENGRNWQVGTYRVAFYVAGLPITSGAFEITD